MALKTSVHFCYPENSSFRSWERETLPNLKREFFEFEVDQKFSWADSPDDASIIVLLESNTFKSRDHIRNLENEPLLNRFPDRVFTYNYEDHPPGFIDGVYAQMPHSRFEPSRHRCTNIIFQHNQLIYDLRDRDSTQKSPSLLFSFRGALSHPIRREMIDVCKRDDRPHALTIINSWYNHSDEEKDTFVQELLNTKFILCPRGLAPYSNRMGEAMAAGRVPIIIADDFEEFSGVDMAQFSLKLKEAEIKRLPDLMIEYESRAKDMGLIARQIWTAKFGRGKRIINLLDQLVDLRDKRQVTVDMDYYRSRWNSSAFRKANGWTLPQRIARKIKRMRDRLTPNE